MRVFADNDLSAAKDDVVRPDYDRLCAAIERGEVEQIWSVEQSRVERREIEWFIFADLMDRAGIQELHTQRDGIVRIRDEVAGIKAVLNAGEVRKLKKRINDTLAEKAARGEPPGGVSLGYRRATMDDGTKTYIIDPAEAAAIRQAADWMLSGWSLSNIAAELQRMGLRGAQGGKISVNIVKSMLTRPTIAGYRVYGGEVVGRGNWEPILDEETWQACRLKLSAQRTVTRSDGRPYEVITADRRKPAGRKYLLTGGLAVCGVCESPLAGTMHRNGKKTIPYLVCHVNKGGRSCTGIVLEKAEEHVVKELFAELDKPEFLNAIAADDCGPRRKDIANALDAIEQQRSALAAMWAKPGELTMAEWQAARQGLNESERELRTELAELPPPAINVDIQAAREAWPDMTLDEQREFIRLFIEKVILNRFNSGKSRFDPDRIQIKWRYV